MEEIIYKSIHRVLAKSYIVFFLFILVGLLVSFFWDQNIFSETKNGLGFGLLILGTLLVFWAQHSSRKTKEKRSSEDMNEAKVAFAKGPYQFFRSPTHLGIFLLFLSIAVLANSLVLGLSAVLSLILTKTIFIKKEEKMLKEKYGEAYEHYKKKVKI